jgi:hypothetical protein
MTTEPIAPKRTPARRKARQLATHLRVERPDYAYLKQVFRHLREELGVEVERAPRSSRASRPSRRSAASTTPSGTPGAAGT